MTTKKVKYAGRFGPRYGRKIRKRVNLVEAKQRVKHVCPECSFPTAARTVAGVFECKKCGLKFAGGAYYPVTLIGKSVTKLLRQGKPAIAALDVLVEAEHDEKLLEEGIAVEFESEIIPAAETEVAVPEERSITEQVSDVLVEDSSPKVDEEK
ncbi:MAG: 50S ribosomal protein L37ae [Candidatus Diapherotrites archaeon]|nr:50S ribosomal protein L37ae [Candidatus Diapherotrites archaeon]